MNYNTVVYAAGAILLGAVGIWFHDFAMQWQAVPKAIPAMPWAYVSGAILVAGGALILARQERWGALLLAGFFVGRGVATGVKEETTVAANTLELIDAPLDRQWLERARRSDSAEPLEGPVYVRRPLSAESWEKLQQHEQFR